VIDNPPQRTGAMYPLAATAAARRCRTGMCWCQSQCRGPHEVSRLYRDRHRSLIFAGILTQKVVLAAEGAHGVRAEVMAHLRATCGRYDSE
jgi:hypothetical protein